MKGSRVWFVSRNLTGVKNLLQDKLQHISINVTFVKYLDRGVVVTVARHHAKTCMRCLVAMEWMCVSLFSMLPIRVCIIKHVILLSLLTREMGCHLSQHLPTLLPGWCRRWHAPHQHQSYRRSRFSPSSKNSTHCSVVIQKESMLLYAHVWMLIAHAVTDKDTGSNVNEMYMPTMSDMTLTAVTVMVTSILIRLTLNW